MDATPTTVPLGDWSFRRAPRNVSDRPSSVTLDMQVGANRTSHYCGLEGIAVTQGSTTIYFRCPAT